jgi:hypothetical protein
MREMNDQMNSFEDIIALHSMRPRACQGAGRLEAIRINWKMQVLHSN